MKFWSLKYKTPKCKKCGKEFDPVAELDRLGFGMCVQCRVEQALSECERMKFAWTPGL